MDVTSTTHEKSAAWVVTAMEVLSGFRGVRKDATCANPLGSGVSDDDWAEQSVVMGCGTSFEKGKELIRQAHLLSFWGDNGVPFHSGNLVTVMLAGKKLVVVSCCCLLLIHTHQSHPSINILRSTSIDPHSALHIQRSTFTLPHPSLSHRSHHIHRSYPSIHIQRSTSSDPHSCCPYPLLSHRSHHIHRSTSIANSFN